jgi:hypothetical protein
MAPSLVKQTAFIEIYPELELLKAEVRVHLENVHENEIEFILAVRAQESTGKLDIIEITQEGKLCKYRIAPDHLFVIPKKMDEKIELLIKYEGKPPQDFDDYIRKDEIILRMDGAWLPLIPSSPSEFEIILTHPSNYTFLGQGIRKERKYIDNNLTRSQWNIKSVNGFTLYGAPEYKIKESQIGDTKLIIALWPKDANLLSELSQKVTTILSRLTELLGEYPYPIVRIVESGRWEGKSGYGAISNISIGYQKLREGIDDAVIAHELSHGWWGGIIPNAQEALYKGQWNETLAEYTSIFALEQCIASNLRKKWSLNYSSLDEEFDIPMLEIGSYSAPNWRINEAITYHKGALLMTSMEDRVGLSSVMEALNKFLENRKGKPSTWEHLLNAIMKTCGLETDNWLREWLTGTLAPELKFSEVSCDKRVVKGRLNQNGKSSYKGQVEIGCFRNEKLVKLHWLSFGENETPFSFNVPPETNRLVIDPRNRIPRRYNPKLDPIVEGIEVRF